MTLKIQIQPATLAQIDILNALIAQSAQHLSHGFYTSQQIQSALKYVYGVDTSLIIDQSYFTATLEGELVGCGGWSRRRTLYGGDQRAVGSPAELLNPAIDAARIRAFFIAPQASRRGVATALFEHCQQAAMQNGFKALELMATLPGVPLYKTLGFKTVANIVDTLPDGVDIQFEQMIKPLI